MKQDTRQIILDTARMLFNTRGYHGVSLQDIADAVGISKGNLTYHFRKKEDIMEGLLLENQIPELAVPTTLQELDTLFLHIQAVRQQHAYYFLHHAQLSQLSPKIAELQNIRYLANRNLFREAFQNLFTAGLLRAEAFSGEYDCTIDTLHLCSIYWGPFSELQQSAGMQREYRRHTWGILHHLLTEDGRKALQTIILL